MGLPDVDDIAALLTTFEASALLKIADEVGFVGAQEFARLSDKEAAAWEALVKAVRERPAAGRPA